MSPCCNFVMCNMKLYCVGMRSILKQWPLKILSLNWSNKLLLLKFRDEIFNGQVSTPTCSYKLFLYFFLAAPKMFIIGKIKGALNPLAVKPEIKWRRTGLWAEREREQLFDLSRPNWYPNSNIIEDCWISNNLKQWRRLDGLSFSFLYVLWKRVLDLVYFHCRDHIAMFHHM